MDDGRRLVQRAQARDAEAFAELTARHLPAVTRVVRTMVRNRQDAEDVVQVALWQAWRDLPRLRGPDQFGSWLLGIARNRALDVLRTRVPEVVPLDEERVPSADPAPGERAKAVRAAIAALFGGLQRARDRAADGRSGGHGQTMAA